MNKHGKPLMPCKERKARFNNRVHTKNKGCLAPSIENKIQTHFKVIKYT